MAYDRCGPTHRTSFWAAASLAVATIALFFNVSLTAVAGEPAAKSEVPQATLEFKPPPGFRPKRRGDAVVYCRKEAVLGSRFPAEKCYDEAGLRELKRAELARTELLERIRACNSSSCPAG